MTDSAAYMADAGRPEQIAAEEAEAAKVAQAKAEIYEERSADPPSSLSGEENLILGKYQNQEELITAYQNLLEEYTKLKGENGTSDPVPETAPQAVAPEQQAEPHPWDGISEEAIATLSSTLFGSSWWRV